MTIRPVGAKDGAARRTAHMAWIAFGGATLHCQAEPDHPRGVSVIALRMVHTISSSSAGAADIVEITGLVPRKGSSTPLPVFDALRLALAENKSGQEPHAYAAQPPQRQQPR